MTGCSAMDLFSAFSPSKGIDAELTVGDKNQTVNAQLGDKTSVSNNAEQVGDRIDNQAVTNYVQNIPMEYLWVLILAIMLPSPTAVGKGIWNGLLVLLGRSKNESRNNS